MNPFPKGVKGCWRELKISGVAVLCGLPALKVGQDFRIVFQTWRTLSEMLADGRIRIPGMFRHPCRVGMWRAVDPLGIGEASGRYAKRKWMVTSSLASPRVDKAPVTARAFQITRVHIIGFVAPVNAGDLPLPHRQTAIFSPILVVLLQAHLGPFLKCARGRNLGTEARTIELSVHFWPEPLRS
jgi:hypothetical protein